MTDTRSGFDAPLGDAIARGRVPGIAAAVVANGAVAAAPAAGLADVVTGAAVDPDTAFLWFSMTKIVTATAAMRLVDDGRLSLTTLVDELVPGVLPSTAARSVVVRHLLQHSAGIPNPTPIRWVRPAAMPAPDPATFLQERFKRVKKLKFEPGSRGAYTNLGYLLLGEVIAAAAGRPFTEFVRDEVLSPLRMHATAFSMPGADDATSATGHQRLARGLGPALEAALPRGIVGPRAGKWLTFEPFLVNGAAYGGLVGTAGDAARVLLAHANGGELDGTRVLAEHAVNEMQQIWLTGRPFDHGLGWFRPPADRNRRPAFVEHYGGGGGYHNLMRLYPAEGVGVVVMGNSTSYAVDEVVDALAAPLLR
jgi:CubicO group peptidase (beta-lactamase class C family)